MSLLTAFMNCVKLTIFIDIVHNVVFQIRNCVCLYEELNSLLFSKSLHVNVNNTKGNTPFSWQNKKDTQFLLEGRRGSVVWAKEVINQPSAWVTQVRKTGPMPGSWAAALRHWGPLAMTAGAKQQQEVTLSHRR